MTSAISNTNLTSFATELAELLIQNEAMQSQVDRAQRDAARAAFLHDAQAQVAALHDAANATEMGAFVSGALTVAGGACEIGSITAQCASEAGSSDSDARALQSLGKTYSALAAPAKAIIGDAPAEHARAEAKQFETLGEQAKWQAGDATTQIDQADKLADKLLGVVQSINQGEDAATNAVIGRI